MDSVVGVCSCACIETRCVGYFCCDLGVDVSAAVRLRSGEFSVEAFMCLFSCVNASVVLCALIYVCVNVGEAHVMRILHSTCMSIIERMCMREDKRNENSIQQFLRAHDDSGLIFI
jgi:hypothetical protein